MLYQDLIIKEDKGIYTALFDSLKDTNVDNLGQKYVTAQKLDSRFSFENNIKDCLFDSFDTACDVLLAKYLAKWSHLINGIEKSQTLPDGATSYTVTDSKTNGTDKQGVSAYDSDDIVTDNQNTSDTSANGTTTIYTLTGSEFLLNLYKNNGIYDIINTDIRKTLFRNVNILERRY